MNKPLAKTFLISLILSILSAVFVYESYKHDLNGIRSQAKDSATLQSEKVKIFLDDLKIKIGLWQKYFETWDRFSVRGYQDYARYFSLLTPSVANFNFTNKDYILAHVFPSTDGAMVLGKNLRKHPDKEIRKIILEGLSTSEITLTPPVEIYQGGRAIVFYAPIKFKKGEGGWLNIVIRTDKLLSEFLASKATLHTKFSISDKETGRFLLNGIQSNEKKHSVVIEQQFEGRMFIFESDISFFTDRLFEKYKDFSLYIFFILFLLGLSLYFYLAKIDEVQSSLVNAKSEKNLLRIMFHDLSNPLAVVQLYAYDLQEKNPEEASFGKMLKRIKQMIEIISSIRHLDYLNRDVSEIEKKKINFKELFDDLLYINQDLVLTKRLKIEVENPKELVLMLRIPFELLKNEIINNLLSNAIKFAKVDTVIRIEVFENQIVIINKSIPISADVLDDLNLIRPTESRAVNHSTKGHGLGFFIAKILSKKFSLGLSIAQDKVKEEVYTTLTY